MSKLHAHIQQAIDYLHQAEKAVALTGAGLSTPSGIPDFRSPTSGVWEHVDPVEVASIQAFREQPQTFYEWIRPLLKQMLAAEPNPAHVALAQLEQHGPLAALITQNIDMLHHRAGSHNVYEVHGHIRQVTCIGCHAQYEAHDIMIKFIADGELPRCKRCHRVLKPDIILYGEMLPLRTLKAAQLFSLTADLMLVAGSSLEVAPAGDLPALAHQSGARLIIVNHGETHIDHLADVVIRADVAEVLPQLAAPFIKT